MWLDADDRIDADNRERLRARPGGPGRRLDACAVKVRSVVGGRPAPPGCSTRCASSPTTRRSAGTTASTSRSSRRSTGSAARCALDRRGRGSRRLPGGAVRPKLERNLRLLRLDHAERPHRPVHPLQPRLDDADLGTCRRRRGHLRQSLQRTNRERPRCQLYVLLTQGERQLGRREAGGGLPRGAGGVRTTASCCTRKPRCCARRVTWTGRSRACCNCG
jgi:hypothetical protein